MAAICGSVCAVVALGCVVALPGWSKLATLPYVFATCAAIWSYVHHPRQRGTLHLYAARNGFFVLYRDRVEEPLQLGRLERLTFDVRDDDTPGLKRVVPMYDGHRFLAKESFKNLTSRDMKTLASFAEEFQVRVE